MFTNYGPYDLHQAELIKQDKQRELATFFGPVTFEGANVRTNGGHGSESRPTLLRRLMAGLLHKHLHLPLMASTSYDDEAA